MEPASVTMEIQQDGRWRVAYGDTSLGSYADQESAQIVCDGVLEAIYLEREPLQVQITELTKERDELQTQLDAINSAVAAGKHSDQPAEPPVDSTS